MKYISNKSIGCIAIMLIFGSITGGLLMQSGTYKSQVESIRIENHQIRDEISQLEKSVNDYKREEQKQNDLFIGNVDIPDKVRFIEKENKLLLLPQEGSRILRNIQTNTLAKVIDRGIVDNTTWIYIEIPVHDTPGNSRGWIKENDTVLYTKDKVQLVQSDILIIAGAEAYETFKYEDIRNTTPKRLINEESGRLEEKKDGYCRISQPGGRDVWVKESSVLYPPAII